jgi:septal ring factor EnvC (AmiA/AmiB activator)
MSMAGDDLTIEILKNIRDDVRGVHAEQTKTNQRLDVISERLDLTIARLDVTNERLDTVESTLLDLAEQQRSVVRYTRALAERDIGLERPVDELEIRVEKLETDQLGRERERRSRGIRNLSKCLNERSRF